MDATASDAFSLTGKSKTGLKRRFKNTELYKVVIGKFPGSFFLYINLYSVLGDKSKTNEKS